MCRQVSRGVRGMQYAYMHTSITFQLPTCRMYVMTGIWYKYKVVVIEYLEYSSTWYSVVEKSLPNGGRTLPKPLKTVYYRLPSTIW